jgi:lysophospholipase L1-like esterase
VRSRRLLSALASITFALLLAEGLVRVLAPQAVTPLLAGIGPDGMVRSDARLGWVWTPGYRGRGFRDTIVEIDSIGLRDHEYGPKRAGEIRILSLGDSFAFGTGVELDETYAKVLERLLRARFPDLSVAVINAGVVGWSQQQMIRALPALRAALAPDLVVATFVAGNDVLENALFEARLAEGVKTPLGPVARRSHAARLLLRALHPLTRVFGNRSTANIAETVELIVQLPAAAAVPTVLVVIPARHQLRARHWAGAALLEGFLCRQNRAVMAACARTGMRCVDTTDALADRDATEPVMFADDAHTNALGHAIIAERVAETVAPLVAGARRSAAARPRCPHSPSTSAACRRAG